MKGIASRGTTTMAVILSIGFGYVSDVRAEEKPPEPPLGQSQAAAKSAYSNRLICTTEPVMGSNIKKKTCRTRQETDQERAAAHNMMNDLNRYQGRNYGGSG